jgi:hypothetical protein
VEVGAVEAELRGCPSVEQVVVNFEGDPQHRGQLTAYVVPRKEVVIKSSRSALFRGSAIAELYDAIGFRHRRPLSDHCQR